jgi:hypothetical protein
MIYLAPGVITELKCGTDRLEGRKLILIENIYGGAAVDSRIAVGHKYVDDSNIEYEFNNITGVPATDARTLIRRGIMIMSGTSKSLPWSEYIPCYATSKTAVRVLVHEMA